MSEKEDFTAQAERAASAILAEHGMPDTYDVAHALVSLGYMQGARDELAMLPGRVDAILDTILKSVGVERDDFERPVSELRGRVQPETLDGNVA